MEARSGEGYPQGQEEAPREYSLEEKRTALRALRDAEKALDDILNGRVEATSEQVRAAHRQYPDIFSARLQLEAEIG